MNLRLEAGNIFDNDLMVVLFIYNGLIGWKQLIWTKCTIISFLRAGCEYRRKLKTGENKDIEDSEKDDRDS